MYILKAIGASAHAWRRQEKAVELLYSPWTVNLTGSSSAKKH